MKLDIEDLDRKRMKHLEWYLISVVLFTVLSITRFFFRLGDWNTQPIGKVVLIGLFLSLAMIVLVTVRSGMLWRAVRDEPTLQEALQNEFVQSIEIQSWKAAFFGAIGTTVFFAIAGFFYPICDPALTALTSIIVGVGSHQAALYRKYRSA